MVNGFNKADYLISAVPFFLFLFLTICNRRERWSFSLKRKKTTRWGVPEQECLISCEWGFVCFMACTSLKFDDCRFHWGKENRGAFCCTESNPQYMGIYGYSDAMETRSKAVPVLLLLNSLACVLQIILVHDTFSCVLVCSFIWNQIKSFMLLAAVVEIICEFQIWSKILSDLFFLVCHFYFYFWFSTLSHMVF